MDKREIKFRAWLPDADGGGRMFFPREMHWRPDDVEHSGMRGFTATDPQSKFISSQVMQYTGLKDKNGVEIYEGDIVRQFRDPDFFPGDKPYTETVVVGEPEYSDLMTRGSGGPDGDDTVLEREVIGNIHENPEMLAAHQEGRENE